MGLWINHHIWIIQKIKYESYMNKKKRNIHNHTIYIYIYVCPKRKTGTTTVHITSPPASLRRPVASPLISGAVGTLVAWRRQQFE